MDDTGLPKKGDHSVGVAPQYASMLGKRANCQTLVSLTLARDEVSVPVGLRLFLHMPGEEAWLVGEWRRNSPRQTPRPLSKRKQPTTGWILLRPARQNAGVHVVDFVIALPNRRRRGGPIPRRNELSGQRACSTGSTSRCGSLCFASLPKAFEMMTRKPATSCSACCPGLNAISGTATSTGRERRSAAYSVTRRAWRPITPTCANSSRRSANSAFVGATLNAFISKRFAKKQQMQSSRTGAHLLLPTRNQTLDGSLWPTFEKWYRGMANDNQGTADKRASA